MSDKMARAVARLNARMEATGVEGRGGTDLPDSALARLFIGLPISSHEGRLLAESMLIDKAKIVAGLDVDSVLRGALRMAILAGVLAAIEPDDV